MKVIVLDTETTGLQQPQPCEIAYFQLNPSLEEFRLAMQAETRPATEIIDSLEEPFEQRFKPLKPMEAGASKVNGIYDKDLADKPCLSTFKFDFEPDFIIGHNIIFDYRALNWNIQNESLVPAKTKLICTKELAQLAFEGQRNNKLVTLIEYLYPNEYEELTRTAHSALQDCKLSFLVLLKVLESLHQVKTWEQLASLCSQGKRSYEEMDKPVKEVTKMPIGKYKGYHINEVPLDYINWMLDNFKDMQPDLKSALLKRLK